MLVCAYPAAAQTSSPAPLEVIQRLPGIDDATARRIVAVREQIDGFSSLEDLGMTLDLDGETVEDLRGKTVFLPR